MSAIDLATLPVPDAVERLDFETILAETTEAFKTLAPDYADVIDLESEPLLKLMQVGAYRELLMRARANDSVRAVLLATATGADLDNLVAIHGVVRQVIVEADPDAVPPVAAVLEDDEALRQRAQLAPEAWTNAGTVASYAYHALSADGRVRDVAITRPGPGQVLVTVLSHEAGGVPSADLLAAVSAVIEEVRPLCDDTAVAAPSFVDFAVQATLVVPPGPGAEVIRAAALEAVQDYVEDELAVGRIVRQTALLARLHQSGVDHVILTAPAADIDPGRTGVARASAITIATEVAS